VSQEKELSSEELGQAVSSILADPAFGRLLSELRGEGGDAAASAAPVSAPAVPAVTPQMLEKLPQMMAALRPLVEGAEKGQGKEADDEAARRRRLLSALRPYLSDKRRGAVDNILRITEMTDLLGNLDAAKRQ